MAIAERDRRALVLGGAALAALAMYLLAVEPLIARYDTLVDDHERLAGQVARTMRENDKLAFYRTRVAEWESNVGPLSPPQPYSEQITDVGDQITTAAQQNGIELKSTRSQAVQVWPQDPTLQLAPVLLEADADFEPVFKFIDALYRIDGVLSVENLDLTGDPKKGGKVHVRLTISVLVKSRQTGGLR